jgi:phage baseplate assembly protein W
MRTDRDSVVADRRTNKGACDMKNISFPFHVDGRGRTALTDDATHVRDMIEQFLFTNPGERVNRPTFGSGLLALVFQPNSAEIASALQFSIQAGLQQWLGNLIQVSSVEVQSNDGSLQISIAYVLLQNQQQQLAQFTRSI